MLRKIPLYPWFLAAFPVLSLAGHNIQEIFVNAIVRPLLASLLLAVIVYSLAYFVTRDIHRSALMSSIILVLFFAYGQFYAAVEDMSVLGMAVFRHRTLIPLIGLVGCIVVWGAMRVKNPDSFAYPGNLISMFLLIFPLFTISSHVARQSIANRVDRTATAAPSISLDGNSPDIYYIILDAYGREDILREQYGFDNSPFTTALRERGFYVADCSQTNYGFTEYSLASSLNHDYLDVLGGMDNNSRVALIKRGAVRSFFEGLGYEIIAFPTGWASTEWRDADIFYDYGDTFTTLSEFEKLLMDTTMLRVQSDFNRSSVQDVSKKDARRMRVFSALEKLKLIPVRDGHTFVFAHLVIPHPPYSFGPDGEWVSFNDGASVEERTKAYTDQVLFINREILEVVDAILSGSESPPVMIIQGDHGPLPDIAFSGAEKMPILNAYYLPGADSQKMLYPSITPVNTFRVVLNSHFDQNLPLLEDVSYYAPKSDHDAFEIIPNQCDAQP